jgi:gluconate 5-dehydrogenase
VGILSADPAERNARANAVPAMRVGMPEDCVGPAVFLASAASDFITGSTLYPDGGLTAIG